MREKEYIRWCVDKGNIKMGSAISYKSYIKKVEEIMRMDIEDIFFEDKKRDKETDPFELFIKEIKTSPENKKKSEKYKRSKWGSAIRKYKEFYYDQE